MPGTQLTALPLTPLLTQLVSGNGVPPMTLISVPVPVVLMLSGLSIEVSVTTATSNPFVISETARSTSRVNLLPTVYCVPPSMTGAEEHPVGATV